MNLKNLFFLFFIVILTIQLSSCTKATSHNLKGTWEVTYYTFEYQEKNLDLGNSDVWDYYLYSDGVLNRIIVGGVGGYLEDFVHHWNFKFNRDNTYEINLEYSTYHPNGHETRTNETITGTWSLPKGNKSANYKKGDRIYLTQSLLKRTVSDLTNGTTNVNSLESNPGDNVTSYYSSYFDVIEVKNKKMELEYHSKQHLGISNVSQGYITERLIYFTLKKQ